MSGSYIGKRVGVYLREARTKKGLTLSEVASVAGVTIGSLSHLESGHRNERLDLDKLQLLAKKVGYSSLSKLIADAERRGKTEEVIEDIEDLIKNGRPTRRARPKKKRA